MSFSYTYKPQRETSFDVKGTSAANGRNMINHSATQTFRVYTIPANGQPNGVTDVEVGCITELPRVNQTTWYSSITGTSMPYAVCRSKTVKRLKGNGFVFDVTCTFETGPVESEQCASIPPTAVTDIATEESVSIGSYERVMYTDKDGVQCWKLPGTETPYATPVVETIPTLTITLTQFETGITYQQMLDRSFKLNSGVYRGKPAGYWMIGAVKSIEQDITVAGPATQSVAKVTYPIMLSERFYYPPGVAATPANATIYSHDHIQPLVDTMKVDAGKIVPMVDTATGNVRAGYIDSTTGEERVPAATNEERPDYVRHRKQDSIDFSSFLQA